MMRRPSPVTLRSYLAARHISGKQPLLELHLDRLGYRRDVRVKMADPFPIGAVVERTDLIATFAFRTAHQLEQLFHIRMLSAPPEIRTFKYSQIWHPRNDSDPAHRWLRSVVQADALKSAARAKPEGRVGGKKPQQVVAQRYFVVGGWAGFANFAGSIGALNCTCVNCVLDRPSTHVVTQWNGILTPFTSR